MSAIDVDSCRWGRFPPTVEVAEAYDSYVEPVRTRLTEIRTLVFRTAAETSGVGSVQDALRWGQPSFVTGGSGSTIRLDAVGPDRSRCYGVFFTCTTNLVATFRVQFGDLFRYCGNRGLLFAVEDDRPDDELRECLAMALSYHVRR